MVVHGERKVNEAYLSKLKKEKKKVILYRVQVRGARKQSKLIG